MGGGSADIRTRRARQKKIRLLRRILAWDVTAIENEAHQRHAGTLIDKTMTSKYLQVSTPGDEDENEPELITPQEVKSYRRDAVRGNYLVMGRSDLQFRVKEISRAMSTPTRKDQRRLGWS